MRGALPEERQFDALQAVARHPGAAPGALAGLLDGEEHLTPSLDQDLGELLVRELRRQGSAVSWSRWGKGGEESKSNIQRRSFPWDHEGTAFIA